jgi:hypothetical protein
VWLTEINLVDDIVIAIGDTQHQLLEIVMKRKRRNAAQKERSKKLVKVRRAWEESGYEAVIKQFRNNEDIFGRNMMQGLEADIIECLMELDDEMLDDYEMPNDRIRSIVLENVVRSTEQLGARGRILGESSVRAWEEFDKLDIF